MSNVVRLRPRAYRAGRPSRLSRLLRELLPLVLAFSLSAIGGAYLLKSDAFTLPFAELPAALQDARSATIRFSKCANGSDATCVIDGDTFRLRGETIRIADIDTPETRDYRCASEKHRGDQATLRLTALLSSGPFVLQPIDRDRDQYGRSLRIVVRDGSSLGARLVSEGLARRWDGRRHPWC